jgi:hypothetical protein
MNPIYLYLETYSVGWKTVIALQTQFKNQHLHTYDLIKPIQESNMTLVK